MADTPDIDLSQHIHSLPFCSLCCGRWTHDIYSKLYLSEAPDNLGKVSGSLRKKWKEGRRLWLGYLFHGSLPMMLIILVGSSSHLDLPKETPLELSLIFSFSLSFGVLVVEKLAILWLLHYPLWYFYILPTIVLS